jgi:hypothetical protein
MPETNNKKSLLIQQLILIKKNQMAWYKTNGSKEPIYGIQFNRLMILITMQNSLGNRGNQY